MRVNRSELRGASPRGRNLPRLLAVLILAGGLTQQARGQAAGERAKEYFDRANSSLQQKQYERVIADYSEAIRLDPGNVGYRLIRAKAYGDGGDLDRAIAEL